MIEADAVQLVGRWAHITSAVLLLGGYAFYGLVLRPLARRAADGGEALLAEVNRVWGRFVHPLVAVAFVSGVYNFYRRMYLTKGLYHGLFGVKLLLGLAMLALASALVGRSKLFAPVRARAGGWTTGLLVLGMAAVVVSGMMRYIPDDPEKAARRRGTTPVQAADAAARPESPPPANR